MNTITVSINELREAEYNPRKKLGKNDDEYKKLKKSIEEFGYVVPIVINNDRTVIGGHQRLTVLRDLGYEDILCVQIDVDEMDEKMLNIALNKIDGEFDMEKLESLFKDLEGSEYDVTLSGFDMDSIDELVGKFDPLAEIEDDKPIEDEKEKMIECPQCKWAGSKAEFTTN